MMNLGRCLVYSDVPTQYLPEGTAEDYEKGNLDSNFTAKI